MEEGGLLFIVCFIYWIETTSYLELISQLSHLGELVINLHY